MIGGRWGRYPNQVLIDSHCHLDDYTDLPAVLERAQAAGLSAVLAIGIGDGPATMRRALGFAQTYAAPSLQGLQSQQLLQDLRIFATAGIHPQEAHQATPDNLVQLETLVQDPLCIAVGEIGLDYYHLENPDPEVQRAAFIAQMSLAAAARKPVTIHCRTSELASSQVKARFGHRDAAADLLDLITEHWVPTGLPGIMHCFSGDQAMADRSVAAGFYLSFAGNLTYPKSNVLQQVAATALAERILVETDAPFLTPQSRRGQGRNEPAFVVETAAFLAGLRGTTPDAIAVQTTRNFYRLFPTTVPAAR